MINFIYIVGVLLLLFCFVLEGAKEWEGNSKKKQRMHRVKYLSGDHKILKVQGKKEISKKGLIILHRDG